jgi:hypothetical protein
MLQYNIENDTGTTGVITPDEIKSQLAAMGEVPKSVSPDGQIITLSDQQGDFDVRTQDILSKMGWKVQGVEPTDVLEDFVKPEFRVAVANLGADDEVKKLYLQEKLQGMGLENANIVGQGTDFYVWHPESNKYFALTNKRGMDMSDFASAASQAPGFLGGVAGGALGAIGGQGFGSIPLGMAGAAGGQALGDVASRGAIAAMDPTFARVAGANLGAQVKDIAGNAAVSGGTAGLFKGIPMALGAMRGAGSQAPGLARGVLENGPISSMARGFGKGAEEGGRITGMAAKPFMNPGMLRDLATSQMPIAGPAQGVGMALQAPGGLARMMAKGYGRFGGKSGQQFTKDIVPDAAGDLPLGRLFEKAGQTYGKKSNIGSEGLKSYRNARNMGLEAEEALNSVRMSRGADYGAKARKVGNALEGLSQYGQKLERAAGEITGGVAKGAYGFGRAAEAIGGAANRVGKAAAPLENRLYTNWGTEEMIKPRVDSALDEYLRRNKSRLQSTQDNLAQY